MSNKNVVKTPLTKYSGSVHALDFFVIFVKITAVVSLISSLVDCLRCCDMDNYKASTQDRPIQISTRLAIVPYLSTT